MTPYDVKQIYDANVKSTEILMHNISNSKNGVMVNSAVTSSYLGLAQNDPAFLWLALGAIVSCTVGKNIHFSSSANVYALGLPNPAEVILKEFAIGNQLIFKSIVPIYKTFQQVGLEGIKLLEVYKKETPFTNENVIEALTAYTELQENQEKIAKSLDLPSNHPRVIETLFNDPVNEDLAYDAAYNIAVHEQTKVQPMYNNSNLVSYMMNPLLGFIGDKFALGSVEIDGVSYKMMDFITNPADIDQRLLFVKILTNALMECVKSKGIESVFVDIQKKAEYMLYLANPHTSPGKMGGMNGYFWGKESEIYEKELLAKIDDFVKFDPSTTEYDSPYWQEIANIGVEISTVKDSGYYALNNMPSGIIVLDTKQTANFKDHTRSLDFSKMDAMLEDKGSENNDSMADRTTDEENLLESYLLEINQMIEQVDEFVHFSEIESISDSLDIREIITVEDFNEVNFDDSSLFEEKNNELNKVDSNQIELCSENQTLPISVEMNIPLETHPHLQDVVSELQTLNSYIFE